MSDENSKHRGVWHALFEAQGKQRTENGIPSRWGVVCWPWSSGTLMLPKHKGYLVDTPWQST